MNERYGARVGKAEISRGFKKERESAGVERTRVGSEFVKQHKDCGTSGKFSAYLLLNCEGLSEFNLHSAVSSCVALSSCVAIPYCVVLRAHCLCTQLLIASTLGSSSPERLGLDNLTSHRLSQPWSDATCPCTTSRSAYFCFVALVLLKKARQSTRGGVTGARCVRPWLTRVIVWTGSFWRR